MSRGVVKFYNGRARYGFIIPEDNSQNVHFAEEALPRDRRYDPQEGDVVEYQSRMGSKGLMAVRIVLDPTTAAPKFGPHTLTWNSKCDVCGAAQEEIEDNLHPKCNAPTQETRDERLQRIHAAMHNGGHK